jgi:hypothetical protein
MGHQDVMEPRPETDNVTDHSIQLTASIQQGNAVISVTSGDASPSLPARSGQHRFNFSLTDNTGLGVTFSSLDAQDNCSTCPPATGENSQQIVGVTMNGTSAAFTDNNRGPEQDVSYQWNFTCNDPSWLPIRFDPIIRNGGGS